MSLKTPRSSINTLEFFPISHCSGSPQQVVAASRQTDLFQTCCIQPFVNILSSGFHSTPSGKVLEGFESKLTRVRPYFKRVVFGRFKIFRALVSTKHLQGSYLRDFRTEKDMLRGNTFFPFFSPKSKLTPVRPYFKRVVFGRFQIF